MFNPKEHLMNLKGKEYLQVMWRLVWFRDEKPNWCIDTQLERLTEDHAVFSAKIYDENGALKSAGYGSEGIKDFRDFIEKAETKAVGRALAMLGYGTQFAPELDEEHRIVDSPVEVKPLTEPIPAKCMKFTCADCGKELKPIPDSNGKPIPIRSHAAKSEKMFGRVLCLDCIRKINSEN